MKHSKSFKVKMDHSYRILTKKFSGNKEIVLHSSVPKIRKIHSFVIQEIFSGLRSTEGSMMFCLNNRMLFQLFHFYFISVISMVKEQKSMRENTTF